MTPKNRIPELDAARGICILSMVVVHLVYDLTELYPLIHWNAPPVFTLLQKQGGILFFLISGICVTLGASHLRRGMQVLGCAAVVSAATYLTGSLPIRFGVLHCLGCCMLLWQFFRNASPPALCLWGALTAAAGYLFRRLTVNAAYLYPLGLTAPDFTSADYFPLLPFFGFFLAGAALGRRLYPNRQSLFTSFPTHGFFRFLCACGRHSLWIYLLHQPILLFLIETALA